MVEKVIYQDNFNFIIVGVAGVGKTTMGQLASSALGMNFIDTGEAIEEEENSSIDTIIEEYGDEGYIQLMLKFYKKVLKSYKDTIIVVAPQLCGEKEFWSITPFKGITIHLRGKPLDVFMRLDTWVGNRLLTREEKLQDKYKNNYYSYYNWRLRHCNKADFTLRIKGNIDDDVKALVDLIKSIKESPQEE